jgi:hypothetical protein
MPVGAGLVRDNRVCSTALSPPRAFSACSSASSVASASARTPATVLRAARSSSAARTRPGEQPSRWQTSPFALARDGRGDNLAVEVTHPRALAQIHPQAGDERDATGEAEKHL